MKRIINDEFIQYKSGFIDGKDCVLKQVLIFGKSDLYSYEQCENDSFYSYGYSDGYNFYLKKYLDEGYSFEDMINKIKCSEVVQEEYFNRVVNHNEKTDEHITGFKFKM